MRLVLLGTPEFACPSLRALLAAGHELALVVTQPDKPRGRGQQPSPTPVKALAAARGLPVAMLERGARTPTYQRILELAPDCVVVVAFGHLVREPLLSSPPLGCLNVHASLLPRWRGAAPIQRAILAGDRITGVTTMRLEAGLDTGPIYLAQPAPIGEDETAGELNERLAALGALLLVRTLEGLAAGTLAPTPQSQAGVTHAPPLRKAEGTVDFAWSAQRVHDTVRALHPWPRATALHGVHRLGLAHTRRLRAPLTPSRQDAAPGTVLQLDAAGMDVACGDGSVRIGQVQPEGGRWMDPASYARGHGLQPGDVLRPLPPSSEGWR